MQFVFVANWQKFGTAGIPAVLVPGRVACCSSGLDLVLAAGLAHVTCTVNMGVGSTTRLGRQCERTESRARYTQFGITSMSSRKARARANVHW